MVKNTCTTTNPSLCLIPFSSLHISPDGSFRLCSSNIHRMFSLEDNVSLMQAWTDARYTSLRESMLLNEKPKVCGGACYSQEDKGLFSKRLKYNAAKEALYTAGEIETDAVAPKLRYIDIAFSNICNLKCVMCTSHYSSSWKRDDVKAQDEGLTFRKPTLSVQRLRPELLDEVLELSPQLYGIWIKGGEPFADEQCLSFLQRLSQIKNRHEYLHLFIQSNGTRWNEDICDAIKDIPIELGISIDGVHAMYEWIRGFPFLELDKNIRAYGKQSSIRKLMFHFTLSAYNVYNIADTVNYFYKLRQEIPKLKTFYFAGIVRQEWGNVLGIPREERLKIAEDLRRVSKSWTDDVVGLENILSVLESHERRQDYFFDTCKRWMEFCDRMRGRSLRTIDPRVAALFIRDSEVQRTVD